MEDIVTVDPDREEGTYEALNQRIHQEVTEKPILARIITETGASLLSAACCYLNLNTSHHVIKSLIRAYPSALLVVPPDGSMTIYMIACHPEHCVLMPWIAANYTWILDHKRCPQVMFVLLDMYVQRQRTSCTATTLKQFFEAYPHALTQQHPDCNILHFVLKGDQECDADLFKWIAERCPSSTLLETDSNGRTLLHHACQSLSKHKGGNSNEICKYLIVKCPASVRSASMRGIGTTYWLPIHLLQGWCGHRLVREVVVCLLRDYPESIDVRITSLIDDERMKSPSNFPFIQTIKPYLNEEKALKETAVSLEDSKSSMIEAVTVTKNKLTRSAFTVYDSWAQSFINTTEDKLRLISTQLQDMCNKGLESDE